MIINVLRYIVDFIFPKSCLLCSTLNQVNNYSICSSCWGKLTFLKNFSHCYHCGLVVKDGNLCVKCELLGTDFDASNSVLVYDEWSKKIITSLKFSDQTILAKYVARIMSDYLFNERADFIIPVPIHRLKLIKRKYNQTVLISKFIEKNTGIPIKTNIIKKIKHTKAQSSLTMDERKFNLNDAFSICDSVSIKGSKIILLDDVVTTGSTASACAKLLKNYSPEKVTVLSFARVVNSYS